MVESARSRRVFVVEDEDAVRRVIVRHLERSGFATREAGSAEDALAQVFRDRQPYDLVLTDVHLPGHSGVELARLLLAHSPLKPVVVITGDPDEALAREALSYGASGYLLKPFELFELDVVVQQALGRLELLEAAELLARDSAAQQAVAQGGEPGSIPPVWLALADERGGVGAGHGWRVARLAEAIGKGLPEPLSVEEWKGLELAARAHELGRLLGHASGRAELAQRSAQFLTDLGLDARTVSAVRHQFERWDGSGGPDGLAGEEIPLASALLAAADAIDTRGMARVEISLEPARAVEEAVEEVLAQEGAAFAPHVCQALRDRRSTVEAIWTLTRSAAAARRG